MCICIYREKLKIQDRGPARGEKNSIILTEELIQEVNLEAKNRNDKMLLITDYNKHTKVY